MEIELKMHGVK